MFEPTMEETRVLSVGSYDPFIAQEEVWREGTDDEVTGTYYYTKDGHCVGDKEWADKLIKKGILENLMPAVEGGRQVAVGFCPEDQTWHGWSHQAMYGFGIGSKVSFGDIAFKPSTKEEFNKKWLNWHGADNGIWRTCETDDIKCTTLLVSMTENFQEKNECSNELETGILLKTKTVFKGADRDFEGRNFHAYPKVWGKGEWIATSLEDAKMMAIDFAQGVN